MESFWAKWLQDMGDAIQSDGGLSSTIPYAKHTPPVDPTWPTIFPQLLNLLALHYNNLAPAAALQQAVAAYVNYNFQVESCPDCRDKDHTQQDGVPIFYMNGDWMEYRDQAAELALSGPAMASLHAVWNLQLAAALSDALGNTSAASSFAAHAAQVVPAFSRIYLQNGTVGVTCGKQPEEGRHSKGGGGVPIRLSCPTGQTIGDIVFASFGTPSGACNSSTFAKGSCDAANSKSVVAGLCLGKSSCEVDPSTLQFSGDPCEGVAKELAINVRWAHEGWGKREGSGKAKGFLSSQKGFARLCLPCSHCNS
jgi:hypothetical protein